MAGALEGSRAAWLEDRPSRPKHCPWATTPEVVEAILDLRRTYDDYGAKKIRWFLQRHRPELDLPSRTTIHNILCRHDLGPQAPQACPTLAPRSARHLCRYAQRELERGLQGRVPDPRWSPLLPAHRPGTCTRASCSPATAALMSPSMA